MVQVMPFFHMFTYFTMQVIINSVQLFTRVQVALGSARVTLEAQNGPGLADIRRGLERWICEIVRSVYATPHGSKGSKFANDYYAEL